LDIMAKVFAKMNEFQVPASAVTFGTLIKAFGHAGQLNTCHQVWKQMLSARATPSIVTFGCYIDACTRNGDMDAAERIFKSMSGLGTKPNSVIYMSMIRGYASAKMSWKALALYKAMSEDGVQTNTQTFNSILDILGRQLSDPSQLRQVIDEMRAASFTPDVVSYSILIKASCNAGQLKEAIALFRQLRAHGLAFDEVAFNTLLLACSKAGKVAEAEEILEEMRAIGMAPTQVTVSILVKMYGQAKMLDKAVAISERAQREHGMRLNVHIYTSLIQACVRNRQVYQSWEFFCRMLHQSDVAPDAITYGTVIHGCIYNNKFEQAMALSRHAYGRSSTQVLLQSLGVSEPSGDGCAATVVGLQPEVVQALTTALQRKGLRALVAELEEITARSVGRSDRW